MARVSATAYTLALLGLIPFVFCAFAVATGRFGGSAWFVPLATYGAIILSFLGGARWGREMASDAARPVELILSNLPAVVAWVGFLPGIDPALRLHWLAGGLIAVWLWDVMDAPDWYRALRSVATAGAVICLILGARLVG